MIEIIVEAIVDDGGPAFLAQVLNVYKDKSPLICQENYRVKKKKKHTTTKNNSHKFLICFVQVTRFYDIWYSTLPKPSVISSKRTI